MINAIEVVALKLVGGSNDKGTTTGCDVKRVVDGGWRCKLYGVCGGYSVLNRTCRENIPHSTKTKNGMKSDDFIPKMNWNIFLEPNYKYIPYIETANKNFWSLNT